MRTKTRNAPALCAMVVAVLSALHGAMADAAANPAEVLELPTVEVVGTTPVPGIGTPIKDVPSNVQIYTAKDMAKQKPSNISEFLEKNPTSVTINSGQGNPFQPDVNFRGFTASPLLGTPQGLSVFLDGVRINEPFGDVVNWDLIPQSAISSIQLIPGSNPTFGLNTLGGALAVYTKSGSAYPGTSIDLTGGSFGRRSAGFETGGKNGNLDYFVTGNYYKDDGWAEHNPSRVKQFFGKVGYQTDQSDLDVSLALADNALQGTQSLPLSFFDNRRQAYTFPDRNTNKLTFLNVKGSHFFTDDVLLGGNVYFRNYRNTNFSSNVNSNFELDPLTGLPTGSTAINDRSAIDQDSYGGALQLTYLGDLAGKKNQFATGLTADLGQVKFRQESQDAEFTADRGTNGTSDFVTQTNVRTTNKYYGLFATDTLSLNGQWSLTLSGRFNRANVKIENRGDAIDDALNGDHTFTRFNPAVGLNFNPNPRLTTYATYNEGMRAPTPIELTCADPSAPCKLPNNFLSDPPLKKVVSKTVELGARGKSGEAYNWSAAVYRTNLNDDIQFINDPASGLVNAGFFQNVGKTRREGLELAYGTKLGPVGLSARYSYVKATFQSPYQFASAVNSAAVDTNGDGVGDTVFVKAGNRIPGIPAQAVKLRADWDVTENFVVGTNIIYSSSVYARGDENNQDASGKVPGYTVVHLDAGYQISKSFRLSAQVSNLFDRRYENFGILGQNFFTGSNRSFGPASGVDPVPEQFRSLGAPRGIWVSVDYSFGGKEGS